MINKTRQLAVEVNHDDMRRITVEDRDLRANIDMGVATTVNAIIAAAIRYGAFSIFILSPWTMSYASAYEWMAHCASSYLSIRQPRHR